MCDSAAQRRSVARSIPLLPSQSQALSKTGPREERHAVVLQAAHKNIDPGAFFERWELGVAWYRDRWDAELANYLGTDAIDFATAARALNKHIAQLREYLTS